MKKYKIEAIVESDLNILELNNLISETLPYWDEVSVKEIRK